MRGLPAGQHFPLLSVSGLASPARLGAPGPRSRLPGAMVTLKGLLPAGTHAGLRTPDRDQGSCLLVSDSRPRRLSHRPGVPPRGCAQRLATPETLQVDAMVDMP